MVFRKVIRKNSKLSLATRTIVPHTLVSWCFPNLVTAELKQEAPFVVVVLTPVRYIFQSLEKIHMCGPAGVTCLAVLLHWKEASTKQWPMQRCKSQPSLWVVLHLCWNS